MLDGEASDYFFVALFDFVEGGGGIVSAIEGVDQQGVALIDFVDGKGAGSHRDEGGEEETFAGRLELDGDTQQYRIDTRARE